MNNSSGTDHGVKLSKKGLGVEESLFKHTQNHRRSNLKQAKGVPRRENHYENSYHHPGPCEPPFSRIWEY